MSEINEVVCAHGGSPGALKSETKEPKTNNE